MKMKVNSIARALPFLSYPALSALLVMPAATAHAQSSMTLYGVIDSAIQYSHSGGTNTVRLDSSEALPSVWGLRGQEDVGQGTKIIFKLENGFNVNTGTTAQTGKMFGREAWVGATGRFGTVTVGENNTPMEVALISFSMGDLGRWNWGQASNNYDFFNSTRVSNSIFYASPRMRGLQISALYARGANGDSTLPRTLGDTAALSINYTRGAFAAEAGYESQVYARSATVTAETSTHAGNYAFFGISYDFQWVRLGGLTVIHRGAADVPAAIPSTYADPNNIYYDVSAQFPRFLGTRGSLIASFGQYKLQRDAAGNSSSLGLRYDYHLSPRTGVYAGVAGVRNGALANFTQTGASYAGIPVLAGRNQLASIIGVVHRF